MRIEYNNPTTTVFTIYDAPALDPITVVVQDFWPGQGRIIIECFGKAWSKYWGGMGENRIHDFVRKSSVDYLVDKLHDSEGRLKKNEAREMAYLTRIVKAVQEALSMGLERAPSA